MVASDQTRDGREQLSVIAEIGVNHDGNLAKALKLIDVAAEAGADIAKFQHFSATKLAAPETPYAPYQKQRATRWRSHLQMLQSLQLSDSDFTQIAFHCQEVGLEFMSTPYSAEDVGRVLNLGVKRYKTASADLVDAQLHAAITATGLPCIASTGMANLAEIRILVERYAKAGCDLTLMHTTSAYPTSNEHLNLVRIQRLQQEFCLPVGFSDHAQGTLGAVMAVAMGARVIEKHITLNRRDHGPDHFCSAEPHEFSRYVSRVREAVEALGTPTFSRTVDEQAMAITSRKSLFWSKSLPSNHVVSQGDFALRRPGIGLNGNMLEKLLGKTTRREVQVHKLVEIDDLTRDSGPHL